MKNGAIMKTIVSNPRFVWSLTKRSKTVQISQPKFRVSRMIEETKLIILDREVAASRTGAAN
jgi:hypothetical protein